MNWKNKIHLKYYRSIIYTLIGNASNQDAQNLFNNLGKAITSVLAEPGPLASGNSGLLSSGISCLILLIGLLAGLYIISPKL